MSTTTQNTQEIQLEGATVAFLKYEQNGITFLEFDSSLCGHPEPMINAMTGLQALEEDQKLVMINSKAPMGLFPKIENDFTFEVEELENGKVKVIFSKRADGEAKTNFADTGCGGGSCSN